MAGTELLGLQRPLQVLPGETLADPLAAVAVDHVDRVYAIERAGRIDDVLQQGPAGEWLQHLRQVGVHALALAGSQDHDGERHLDTSKARGGEL